MRFKDLGHGQVFEFTNKVPGVSELGPWVRISKRKYMASEVSHRLNGVEIEVGTLNVEVSPMVHN